MAKHTEDVVAPGGIHLFALNHTDLILAAVYEPLEGVLQKRDGIAPGLTRAL